MRVQRVGRSVSVMRAVPSSVQAMVEKRCSVRASSRGSPSKGASSANRASRCGASTRGSPSSCASLQTSVAGAVGFQRWPRGPVATPPIGTLSASGRFATTTAPPSRVQTSTERAKRFAGSSHENGRSMRSTSTCRLSGPPETRA